MKKNIVIFIMVWGVIVLTACQKTENKENEMTATELQEITFVSSDDQTEINQPEIINQDTFIITVGNEEFIVEFADNSSAQGLKTLLEKDSVTIEMSDYGGFEKVGQLNTTLPQNNSQISTQIGDIILYQGNQFVIYYGNNHYSLTRLGKIKDTTNLKEALGNGDVTVTLTLN